MDIKYLNHISSPDDIRGLNDSQIKELAEEIRYTLIDTVSKTGGHLASNLGVVELTLAMHLCFESPKDSFVWDVGHQCYTHKLLTGRYEQFGTLRQNGGISGFPNPEESNHDIFAAGHSGASIAAAYGLSVAKKINNDPSYTVAVIGDGSFTGGLVYEALNNAGADDSRLIVVLNENEMSISPNVGALAMYLAAIRTNPRYYNLKNDVKGVLHDIPVIGDRAVDAIGSVKKALKEKIYSSTFFEDIGFNYMGPIDGHDINALRDALEGAKTIEGQPVLLHIKTTKGKGYEFAEKTPSKFHGISHFDINTGEPTSKGTNFSNEFGKYLCKFAEEDEDICAVTAAMALGTGLDEFSKRFPDRFFDVGIAEEFGATFSGGLAKGGKKPVFAVYSTFLQRAYDEISHDVAMQKLKVIFAVDRAGFVGDDGRSHQGIFDVAFLRTIPTATIYSPSTYKGLGLYLYRALYEDGNVIALRYPRGGEGYIPEDFIPTYDDYTVLPAKTKKRSKVTLVTYGSLFSEAAKARDALEEQGIGVEIIKLNKVWPINDGAIDAAMNAKNVLFYEEGCRSGGIGENFGMKLLEKGYKGSYKALGVDNTFVHHASVDYLRDEFELNCDHMVKEILEIVK